MKHYFSYYSLDGFELHETADEAQKAAQKALDYEREECSEGWSEYVESICWGKLNQHVIETMIRPRAYDDGLQCSPEIDTIVDYGLVDILQGTTSVRILTCVYCGQEYPQDTPAHSSEVLTEHIKICDRHPMRQSEADIALLRSALAGLIGADTEDELKQIEAMMRVLPAPEADKAVSINAIHALLATWR